MIILKLTCLSLSFLLLDPNCLQIRAPASKDGKNLGHFELKEHIGHVKKEFTSLLAPIVDLHDGNADIAFHVILNYSDTNHSRVGYEVDIVVMTNCSTTFNEQLIQQFIVANLDPRII